jgi:predicted chitinase
MANYNLNDLRYSIERLKTIFPKSFQQREEYKQRNAANHTIKPKNNQYGTSGELDDRPNAENDFNR